MVPRDIYSTAAEHGFIGIAVPEKYGGAGVQDFRFNMVLTEECMFAGMASLCVGFTLQNDLCLPYFLAHTTDAQKRRWLAPLAQGESLAALALTEPGAGSDLASIATTAVEVAEGYVVDGAKTFFSGGLHADLVITAVKTDRAAGHAGVSSS